MFTPPTAPPAQAAKNLYVTPAVLAFTDSILWEVLSKNVINKTYKTQKRKKWGMEQNKEVDVIQGMKTETPALNSRKLRAYMIGRPGETWGWWDGWMAQVIITGEREYNRNGRQTNNRRETKEDIIKYANTKYKIQEQTKTK